MKNKTEILTRTLSETEINEELASITDILLNRGHNTCQILFGAFWGNKIYDVPEWKYIEIPTDQIINKVKEMEKLGYGKIGGDNLYIRAKNLPVEFRFCDDSDIHIIFSEKETEITNYFISRWSELGLILK